MRAIVKHTEKVYHALLKASKTEEIDGDTVHIYRGPVSKLYQTLGIPQAYYTEIFAELSKQECIINLQRGSKNVDTVILLRHPPEAGDFASRVPQGLTSAEDSANLREMILLHDKLIGGMDIVEAFLNVEQRLQRLEQLAGTQENSVSKQS